MPVRKCQPDSVPAPVVTLEIGGLLLARELGRLHRVDAERHHIKILAGVERHRLQAAGQPVQKLVAEHRAAIIHRHQDHRPATEKIAQAQVSARIVPEGESKRKLHAQLLVKPHLAHHPPESLLSMAGGPIPRKPSMRKLIKTLTREGGVGVLA